MSSEPGAGQKEVLEHQKEKDRLAHEKDKLQADLGYLGRFFGNHPSVYIAGALAAVLLFLIWVAFGLEAERFKVVLPLLGSAFTTIMGYIFGRSVQK